MLAGGTVWLFAGSLAVYERSDDARLEARGAYEVASPVTARVVALRFALGARVHAGDVLVELEDQTAQRTIRATVTGSIGEVGRSRPGSVVVAGERLATVVPDGELAVVARFAPAAAGRLRPGQAAQLELYGFPPGEYGTADAIVTQVGTELHDGLVQVELALAHGLPSGITARHGLRGAIEIRIEDTSPASLLYRATGARAGERDAAPGERDDSARARL